MLKNEKNILVFLPFLRCYVLTLCTSYTVHTPAFLTGTPPRPYLCTRLTHEGFEGTVVNSFKNLMPTWGVGAKLRNKEPEGESETFHADFQITNIQTNIKLNRYVYILSIYILCLSVCLFLVCTQ